MHKFCCFCFFFFLYLFSSTTIASFDDYTAFVYVGCSQSKRIVESPYNTNVESLFASLANAAAISSYESFTCTAASAANPAYGLFQCRTDLAVAYCASCVRSAIDQLSSLCPGATGAAVQLKGCLIRYADDAFLGKLETNLLFKKCGAPASDASSASLLGMRDAAFDDLSSGGGSYRVGAAGRVRALALCVGDLTGKQCGDCVAAALAELKDACGVSDGGDAYLGKCYASYWSDGAYALGQSRGKRPYDGLWWSDLFLLCFAHLVTLIFA
ncbi:plasmodesmata-located protein 7-like [Zingiber officinale]|uniref:Gnk2-homologous domain-containing protein n=1 Tax=Zingiber officinale TaxID=94328 RepID=A0A8J5I148_ZINOF|nr:plasmodesmata-located protein 7-like [Zingiber officinale]KAG6525127.1 hypothetical protein ZIOFF_015079 [Zingiber officinale]